MKFSKTEDNEMHYRMKEAGYKFCLDPKLSLKDLLEVLLANL